MKRTYILSILISFILIGCATSMRINKIAVGMSERQAIRLLGQPASVSSQGEGVKFLNYRFSETDDDAFMGRTTPYYVLISNGKVKQYGRHGDFGTTKDPTLNINTTNKGNTVNNNLTSTERMRKELVALKKLFDEKIITKDEYLRKKKDILNRY